jgi:5-methylcytosine-specific restriction protein A
MPVSFDGIVPGQRYSRPALAKRWGYASYEAISRGAVTPAGTPFIILFITKDKQTFLPQYKDELVSNRLVIEGENSHTADARIVAARGHGDQIHLFYRERHHSEFEYKGEVYLVAFELRTPEPSHFELSLDLNVALALGGLQTESITHGASFEEFVPDEEGRRHVREHVSYERSPRNRARALAIHGTRCLACGFSFDEAYGSEHAASYIEMHHVVSIAAGPTVPNPDLDLIPLCSNCHSMVHRRRGEPLPVEELRRLLQRATGL